MVTFAFVAISYKHKCVGVSVRRADSKFTTIRENWLFGKSVQHTQRIIRLNVYRLCIGVYQSQIAVVFYILFVRVMRYFKQLLYGNFTQKYISRFPYNHYQISIRFYFLIPHNDWITLCVQYLLIFKPWGLNIWY